MSAVEEITLKRRYAHVLAGFEKHSFPEEAFEECKFDLETALGDLRACLACEGRVCKTYYGELMKRRHDRKQDKVIQLERVSGMDREQRAHASEEGYPVPSESFWYGLSERACTMYARPSFAFHRCPGPERRKIELKWRFVRRCKDEIPKWDEVE